MANIRIVRSHDVLPTLLPGSESKQAGWIKRILYSPDVEAKSILMGIAEVNPGYSPHRWHSHTTDETGSYHVIYPENFEEAYYILEGEGMVQWTEGDGTVSETKVGVGDTIFFPIGAPKHQLLNDQKEKIVVLFVGGPPVRFIQKT